ncbi:putative Protein PNS1, variant 2 [Basidiobolus ranarum]
MIHVTVAGVFSSHYLSFNNGGARLPSIRNFARAATTSFGSICYGSLVLPSIRSWMSLASSFSPNDTIYSTRLYSFFVESAKHVNLYGFTHIAIYGKPYCLAAQDSWKLIHEKKVVIALKRGLIGNILILVNFLLGTLTGLFTYLYLILSTPAINHQHTLITCLTLYSGMVGFSFFNLISEWIQAGNIATFVAVTEDLESFSNTNPDLLELIEKEGGVN